jgi:hypothetical protein
MAEHGGKAPPPGKGGSEKKSGGFWGFLGDVLSNVSVDINVGKPSRPGASARHPTDPAQRMEPVHAERQEAYEETIYRKTEGADGTAPAVRVDRDRKFIARSLDERLGAQAESKVPQGGGSPLSREVRAKMEPRLGSDLSGVRVHTGGESAAAAEGLSAKAFTVGSDVHFGAGNFQPGTKEGDRLIAHELTHVVQGQRSGIQRKNDDGAAHDAHAGGDVSHPDEPAEKEADKVADGVTDDLHGQHAGADGGGGHAPSQAHEGVGKAKAGGGAQNEKKGTADGKNDNASQAKHGADAKGGTKDGGGHSKDGAEAKAGSTSKDGGDAKGGGGLKDSANADAGKSGDATKTSSDAGSAPKENAPAVARKIMRSPQVASISAQYGGRRILRATTPSQPSKPPASPPGGGGGQGGQTPPPDPNQVAFTERRAEATMAGGSEKIALLASVYPQGDGPAKLMIANQSGVTRITNLLTGPIATASNKKGSAVVNAAITKIAPAVSAAEALQIKGGKVDKTKLAAAQAGVDTAAGAVSELGAALAANALEAAMHARPAKTKQTVNFEKPVDKWPKEYTGRFTGDMVRQLQKQQTGINAQTVDKWVINVNTYRPTNDLNAMDESAKQVVLENLHQRANAALPKAQARLAELKQKKAAFEAEQQGLQAAEGDPAKIEAVTKKIANNDKYQKETQSEVAGLVAAKPEIDKGKKGDKVDAGKLQGAGGRAGNEKAWADKHRKAKEEIVRRVQEHDPAIKQWWDIVQKAGDLAVLHNPDQIAGGKGEIEPLPEVVKEPKGADDTPDNREKWENYLKKVREYFGVLAVNSSLGPQWDREIDTLYNNVRQDPDTPEAAYGIRNMNVELKAVDKK